MTFSKPAPRPQASAAPGKLDLYKEHQPEYRPSKEPVLIQIEPAFYLAVDGQGAPGGSAFTAAVGALYGVAFTIKMTRKMAGLGDYKVCSLEGLWTSDNEGPEFWTKPFETWRWTLLIRTPPFISQEDLEQAIETLIKKGKNEAVRSVRLETLKEGACIQMLHVGPYNREQETIEQMKQLAAEEKMKPKGLHHEIYLSDPRRVAPERLRTILRQPVQRD